MLEFIIKHLYFPYANASCGAPNCIEPDALTKYGIISTALAAVDIVKPLPTAVS